MRPRTLVFLLLIGSLCPLDGANAQERVAYPEGTVRVVTTAGTAYVGVVEREDETAIVLRTDAGVIVSVPRDQVESVTALGGQKYFRTDPNRTRLFFAPTGRALGSGAGYVAVYEIFLPFVAVGVGPIVSLSGGMSINPGSGRLLYAAPKATVLERENLSIAVGGIGVAAVGNDVESTAGMVFGLGTFGRETGAVTAGIAIGFLDGEIARHPVFLLGGEVQLSNNVKLLTENYFLAQAGAGVLVSGGVRFFGDRIAADLALFTVTSVIEDLGGFPFFPWIGFAYNF